MNISNKIKKAKAVEMLKELDIYKPYIDGFKEENNVCYFERYAGYWAYQDEELIKKIKQIEQRYNCLVYAVTHEYLEFGECYSLLVIPDYKEDWDYILEKAQNGSYAYAYVWNKTDNDCSEFGTIGVESFGGGLKRVC